MTQKLGGRRCITWELTLGGTNIAAGVVDENYKIIGAEKIKTGAHRPFNEIFDDIARAAGGRCGKGGASIKRTYRLWDSARPEL